MVTITKPIPKRPNVPVYEPDEISLAPENTENIADAVEQLLEGLIDGSTEKVKFPLRITRRISAIYHKLVGPPFTERDRTRAILADIENRRRGGHWSV